MGLGILAYIHSQLPIIFYILCIIAFVATLAGRRQIGYYYFLFLLPFAYTVQKIHQYPLGTQVLNALLASLVIATFIYHTKKVRSVNSTPILLHVAVVLISFLYGFVNEGPFMTEEFGHFFRISLVKTYLYMPIMYWVTLAFLQEKEGERRRKTIVYFILFVVVLVDWRFWNSAHWRSHAHFNYGVRDVAFGSLGANHLSAFVVEYTAVAISLFLHYRNNKAKAFFFIVIAAAVYPIFYTYSRAGYVAIVMVLLWNGLFKKKVFFIALVGLVLAGGAVMHYLPQSVIERVTMTKTETGEIESSAESRIIIWEQGKELFLGSPIYGIGYQMVPTYINVHGLRNMHNYLFQMLVETGIIGFSIFIYLLYSAFRSGWRLFVQSTGSFDKGLGLGFCGCVLASVICNFFGDRWSFIEMQSYWWVLWAVCDSRIGRGNL